jgi:hypothetical protein
MRKTIVLAAAVAVLAVATIVTDLMRADAGPHSSTASVASSVQQVQTAGGLKAI